MEWLREHVTAVPVRLIFESALELMSLTQVGWVCCDLSGTFINERAGPGAHVPDTGGCVVIWVESSL